MILAAALVFQVAGWGVAPGVATVGDTVLLTRRVSADPGAQPYVQALASSTTVEPLAHPVVGYVEGAVVVQYTLAFFEPGEHTIAMPDIELRYGDGRVVHVTGDTARVRISSILPSTDSIPDPMPVVPPVERQLTRALLVLPLAVVVLAILLLAVWVRRRVRDRPVWLVGGGRTVNAPVEQWVKAGELRAVVSAVTERLRERIERDLPEAGRHRNTAECIEAIQTGRPDWPVREIADVLSALDRARFAPALPSDVVVLAEQVEELMASIPRGDQG